MIEHLGNTRVSTAVLAVFLAIALPGRVGAETYQLDEAYLFFEENTTDGDLGLHMKVDGSGWRSLTLESPSGELLLYVEVTGTLGDVIGLTELFSESAEPGYDALPREDFLAFWEYGEYTFRGLTIGGDELVGSPVLTGHIPEGPEILSPEWGVGVNAEEGLIVEWEPVPDPARPGNVITFTRSSWRRRLRGSG
jgi:hypothetical protein